MSQTHWRIKPTSEKIEKEVILETPPNKKHSKTLSETIIVHELFVEHDELHGDPKIPKIIEEI
jgi:hypothetical protein